MTGNLHTNRWQETFRGKGILVTGGGGYLGSSLVSLLSQAECRIFRLGRRHKPQPETGLAQVADFSGDVSDPNIWEQCLRSIDFVFHFAAQTSTYVANADPVADHVCNVLPMLHLLENCRRRRLRPMILFASTVTVAGIPEHLPVNETHPDHPLTVYDLHKQMAEQYLRWYAEQGFVRGVTLRLSNVYGPGPCSGSADRGILNQMIRRALAGEPLTVYGAGNQVRDYVYVEDVARAFIAAAQHGEGLNGRYFVLGSGEGHTIAEAMGVIARCAEEKTGKEVPVQHIPPPNTLSPIEGRNFIADAGLFRQTTGWAPQYSLAEGVMRTMEAAV